MKRLLNRHHALAFLVGLVMIVNSPISLAQGSPVRIHLVTTKSEYLDNEPIGMTIRVSNGSTDINAQAGFFAQNFHLLLDFIDPDGRVVRTFAPFGGTEPGPPELVRDDFGRVREAVECELIPANEFQDIVVDNMRVYYDLRKTGRWQARVVTSLVVFQEFIDTPKGRRCFLKDPGTDENLFTSYSPLTSNRVSFTISRSVPILESSVQAHARLMIIGTGTHPPVSKSDLAKMPVYLLKDSDIPDELRPVNHKTYALILERVRPIQTRQTNSSGIAQFPRVAQDAYVLIGYHRNSGLTIGASVAVDEPEWTTQNPILKKLMVMQNNKGKKSAAKGTRRRGSDLWILEPEYVEWDSSQEPYPFVFESVGDWSVTTSLGPPEGFVADHPELSADVTTETEAVQFTITEVGSRWKETKVKHKIKHKGKSEVIESEIGVKLSKKLSKAKGLPVYGETDSPGVFRGGKKVKKK